MNTMLLSIIEGETMVERGLYNKMVFMQERSFIIGFVYERILL